MKINIASLAAILGTFAYCVTDEAIYLFLWGLVLLHRDDKPKDTTPPKTTKNAK